jgi:hypothetical protein
MKPNGAKLNLNGACPDATQDASGGMSRRDFAGRTKGSPDHEFVYIVNGLPLSRETQSLIYEH